MKKLQNIVRETIQKFQMISAGDLVIVGVSGGPDSLTMLHVLKELQDDFLFKLHVAHVDHSFRGREAEKEAQWVKGIAEKWGFPCTVAKVDVPSLAKEKKFSAQEAGHIVRKDFFTKLLLDLGAQKIALGHQADDQAETVLMHFLVGAGLEGLQGIKPISGSIIRPLLFLRREEIERYCHEKFLEPRHDPSNKKSIYFRNKIRQQIIPCLEEKSNPNLVGALNKTAYIIQADEDFLQQETEELAQGFIKTKGQNIILSLANWDSLHIAMQRRLIRLVYKKLVRKQGLAFLHVEQVLNFIKEGQVSKVCQLPQQIVAEKGYEEIWFFNKQSVLSKQMGIAEQLLKIPGETYISETGQAIVAEIVEEKPFERKEGRVCLPWEVEMPQFHVRSRRAGDRFSPLGLQGSKKLKDYFIEKKIPRRQRESMLLIVAGHEIVWIPALAVTEKCRMKSKSGKYLMLSVSSSSQELFEKK